MFTSDQYAQIAKSYADAAADPFASEGKRQEFAKRAEWFHYLAARDKGSLRPDPSPQVAAPPPRRSFAPFLTTLWLTGAGLYLVGTLLFTNAIGLFDDDVPNQVSEVRIPVERERPITGIEEKTIPVTAAERPHAISPYEPYYEAPELTLPATENEDLAPPVSTEIAASVPPSVEPEMFKVTKAATIRNGPSTTAKVIGTATPGAELQVKRHENGWIQFVDPSSGNSGWIQSNVAADAEGSMDAAPAASEGAQSANLKKDKPVKKEAKQKPPSANTAQPRSRRDPRYAELPNDEEFLADRDTRRMGLFARRRMLREGLMSPGFLPP